MAERRGELHRAAELRYGVLVELQKDLQNQEERLEKLAANGRMLSEEVTGHDIAEVVSHWDRSAGWPGCWRERSKSS